MGPRMKDPLSMPIGILERVLAGLAAATMSELDVEVISKYEQ